MPDGIEEGFNTESDRKDTRRIGRNMDPSSAKPLPAELATPERQKTRKLKKLPYPNQETRNLTNTTTDSPYKELGVPPISSRNDKYARRNNAPKIDKQRNFYRVWIDQYGQLQHVTRINR